MGVELEPVDPLGDPVVVLQQDLTAPETVEHIKGALGREARAVFCDAAPKLTGIKDVDRASLEELYDGALRIAQGVLSARGSLVIKGFPGPESDRFRGLLRKSFPKVREVRPEAKRETSKEFYWVAGPEPRARKRRRKPRGG